MFGIKLLISNEIAVFEFRIVFRYCKNFSLGIFNSTNEKFC